MSAEALDPDDDQYISSEDSDFAPDAAPDAGSEQSDSDDDAAAERAPKQQRDAGRDKTDGGDYDNSGDEAIIERGKKRRKKAKNKAGGNAFDDEGGEGGLVKTRRQRAAEKEERKHAVSSGPVTVDVDAIWKQMISGKPPTPSKVDDSERLDNETDRQGDNVAPADANGTAQAATGKSGDPSDMIRIKRKYNFAGRVHTEEKVVPRDSAEARLFLASNGEPIPEPDAPPAKRVTKKAFRSAFEPLADPLPQRGDLNLGVAARLQAGKDAAQAKKLNTVEKSRMDWAGYVDKEGIKDELELASKSKGSYTAREDFLARSEARRDEDARRVRMAGRT